MRWVQVWGWPSAAAVQPGAMLAAAWWAGHRLGTSHGGNLAHKRLAWTFTSTYLQAFASPLCVPGQDAEGQALHRDRQRVSQCVPKACALLQHGGGRQAAAAHQPAHRSYLHSHPCPCILAAQLCRNVAQYCLSPHNLTTLTLFFLSPTLQQRGAVLRDEAAGGGCHRAGHGALLHAVL